MVYYPVKNYDVPYVDMLSFLFGKYINHFSLELTIADSCQTHLSPGSKRMELPMQKQPILRIV